MKKVANRSRCLTSKFVCALLLACCLLLPVTSWAQSTTNGAGSDPTANEVHVKLKMLANVKAVQAGQPFKLAVELTMDPHWHTYYKESGDAGMPTSIDWKLPPGFKAGELLWVKPERFNDSGIVTFGYENKTLIAAVITPPGQLDVGKQLTFAADVKWLSCRELCLPGQGKTSLALPVSSSTAAVQSDNQEAFAKANFTGHVSSLPGTVSSADGGTGSGGGGAPGGRSSADGTAGSGADTTATSSGSAGVGAAGTSPGNGAGTAGNGAAIFDEKFDLSTSEEPKQLLPSLLLALVGGLILNLMPCVLPVIAIKVLSFMQQAREDSERVRRLGLTFIAGIMSSFMLLAVTVVVIQSAGVKAGWGFQFQYPGFVIAMCAVVLLFALSLFGLFYVSVNCSTLDKLSCKEGYSGTFFKGVLATVLSTPCTAPCLGPALGYAFSQSWPTIMLIFFMIGLGMSLPYVVLCFKPDLIKFIPKPGVWMEKFKESLGFILLATVVWLLWVLGTQVGLLDVIWTLAFLVCLSFAAWFVARFTDLTSSRERKLKIWAVATVLTGVSFYYFIAIQPGIGFLASANAASASVVSDDSMPETVDGITWQPLHLDKLQQYREEGKTVFLDFTAQWCLTCKANEKAVLMSKPVIEKFKSLHVVTMKADWTKQDATITKLLNKFGRSGVPMYVIFPADKPHSADVLPEVITIDIVLHHLEQAGASK